MTSSVPTNTCGQSQNKALELYTRNIPYPPSLLEVRNQFRQLILMGILMVLYHLYGQQMWSYLSERYDMDNLGYTATFLYTLVLFWGWSLFFFILDCFPERFNHYRVQNFRPVNMDSYKKAFVTGFINTVLVSAPFGYVLHLVYKSNTSHVNLKELPSLRTVATEHVAFGIILQIAFYYSHRMLHLPFFYKRIHKKHHEFVAPVGMAAVYAHPIEHMISNLLPIFIGPMIMRSHIVTYWIWATLTITGTMINHSNYCLPGLGSPVNHDFHHYVQEENYGVFGMLDHLHGTDKQYLEMLQILKAKQT